MTALKRCPTCDAEYPANERFCPRDGSALRVQGEATDLVGSVIGERYHVIRKLGEGGMGHVYLAEHVKMGRRSAVKVMNASMMHDADAISRFNREAANASRLNHGNIAGIYDFGETAEGVIYLAMEFVEGEALTELVKATGALAPERAAGIARQVAAGLAAAHEMGIVHRDLKPDNIMIAKNRDGSDCVKVVDFGIAKAANNAAQKVTRTGLIVGTPEYMSPEQLAGDKLDGRSDIYALGLVTFNMLTGTLPFPSETAQESMIMRLTERPRALSEMRPDVEWPAAVQQVIARALERDVTLRFQRATDFAAALSDAVESMPARSAAVDAGTLVMDTVPATRVAPSGAPIAPAAVGTEARKSRMPYVLAAGLIAGALLTGLYLTRPPIGSAKTDDAATGGVGAPGVTRTVAPPPDSLLTRQTPTPAQTGAATPAEHRVATDRVQPPRAEPSQLPVNTAPAAVSHAIELDQLLQAAVDRPSAARTLSDLGEWRAKTLLPADSEALKFIAAKATMFRTFSEGCHMMKRVRRAALDAPMRSKLDEGVQTCESLSSSDSAQ